MAKGLEMLNRELEGREYLCGEFSLADVAFADTGHHLRALFCAGTAVVAFASAGIVIRALAPVLADKRSEPPVVAVAEDGSAASFGVDLGGTIRPDSDLTERLAGVLGEDAREARVGSFDAIGAAAAPADPEIDAADLQTLAVLARGREVGVAAAALLIVGEVGLDGDRIADEEMEGPARRAGTAASAAAFLAGAFFLAGASGLAAPSFRRTGVSPHSSSRR